MRVGVFLPASTSDGNGCDDWQHTADLEDLSLVAMAADRLRFHHLAWPVTGTPPASWDLLQVLALLALRTAEITLLLSNPPVPKIASLEQRAHYRALCRAAAGRLLIVPEPPRPRATPLDPIGDPAGALHQVRERRAARESMITVSLSAVSADHFSEQMIALSEVLAEDGEF